jgi:hypothetical protein
MNEAKTLLASLINDGVRISINGENLTIDSLRGILTPQTKELLRRLKPDVLRLLQQQDHDRHFDGYIDAYNEKLERGLSDEDIFGSSTFYWMKESQSSRLMAIYRDQKPKRLRPKRKISGS